MNAQKTTVESCVITKAQLIQDFKRIGIKEGDSVAVALSLKSIGSVQGGADTFIDALLEAVGKEGTLMMNTHTYNFPVSEIRPDYIFDPDSTTPWTGIAPKTLLKRAGVIRSRHPVCSVVALGKHARFLTDGHNEKARPYLPYWKLAQLGGKYFCIGIGNNLVAIRHEAQYQVGIPRFLRYGVQYKDTNGKIKLFVWEHPPCEKNLPNLVPEIDRLGLIKHGKIGYAQALLMLASDLIFQESVMLRNNPSLNQCSDILCVQCRTLEKNTKLLADIAEPRFFQRSLMMRKVIQLRNFLVILKKHSRVKVQKKNSAVHYYLDFSFQLTAKLLARILS